MSRICFVVLTNEKHWLLFSLESLIINCLIVATEQPTFCFYFGTISINSSFSSSWLYSQPLTSRIIGWIVGMLKNTVQGRPLGGRCSYVVSLTYPAKDERSSWMGILPSHTVWQMQNREHNPHTVGQGEASQIHHMRRETLQALSISQQNSSLHEW